jgi:hypothetical protein
MHRGYWKVFFPLLFIPIGLFSLGEYRSRRRY